MHTPLEDVEEYEPLFPDEEGKFRGISATERFKRREMKRFPSQDIWEDTPNSLQLQATVKTPEAAEAQDASVLKSASATSESPEAEKARKGEVSEKEKSKLIPKEERLLKSKFKPHLREEMDRPAMKQRFPSRDIWEDSPDSARLETTVAGSANGEPTIDPVSELQDEGLRAGAVVSTSGRPDAGIIGGEQARDGVIIGTSAISLPSVPPRPAGKKATEKSVEPSAQAPPSIPARPPKRLHQVPPADAEVPIPPSKASAESSPIETKQPSPAESRKAPTLPERPKPDIPPRPANPIAQDSSESIPLAKVTSSASTGSVNVEDEHHGVRSPPPAPKPKPAVPSRPAGGKIAALKAGFLSDLDKRLQLGPQGSKPQAKPVEEEKEKAPLADARKGRARGPARRKSAAPAPAAEENTTADSETTHKPESAKWALQEPWTVWTIEVDGPVDIAYATSDNAISLDEDSGKLSATTPEQTPLEAYSASIKDSTTVMVTETAQQLEHSNPGPLAKLAKETSMSNDPISLDQATATQNADQRPEQASKVLEASTSSFARGPPTASSHEMTSSTSQTGERNITANAGSGAEEKMTAIVGGKAQATDAGNIVVGDMDKAIEE